ncbi:hypothetical protein Bbelb_350040 [Branchiostoma belcheri]|nr:hypothetical protein Bbelb_350040 [Branchiostoma belcheri]
MDVQVMGHDLPKRGVLIVEDNPAWTLPAIVGMNVVLGDASLQWPSSSLVGARPVRPRRGPGSSRLDRRTISEYKVYLSVAERLSGTTKTNTVYEYSGCLYHGCQKCFKTHADYRKRCPSTVETPAERGQDLKWTRNQLLRKPTSFSEGQKPVQGLSRVAMTFQRVSGCWNVYPDEDFSITRPLFLADTGRPALTLLHSADDHRIPIISIRSDIWTLSDSTRVCSAHFPAEDFTRTLIGLRKLKAGAVPSIFDWTKTTTKRCGPRRRLNDVNPAPGCSSDAGDLTDNGSSGSVPAPSAEHDYLPPSKDEQLRDAHAEIERLQARVKEVEQEKLQLKF